MTKKTPSCHELLVDISILCQRFSELTMKQLTAAHPLLHFLLTRLISGRFKTVFFSPLKLGHSDQKRKTSIILQVLCLARVNKGAVVITEDLQVVRMVLVILLFVIQLMIATDLIRA